MSRLGVSWSGMFGSHGGASIAPKDVILSEGMPPVESEGDAIEVKIKEGWTLEQRNAAVPKVEKINSLEPTVTTGIKRLGNNRGSFEKAGGSATLLKMSIIC
ncbi:hypothetical protein [Mucilaginibacter endophyticus]|uniref:hypothetical protein n=1 Tax=Mucilaginibacter endophyticus TaxID=2675003 RepID=UPI000E0DB9F7|nr:hypothetical protein [Mucilaginibacter endophyticus]